MRGREGKILLIKGLFATLYAPPVPVCLVIMNPYYADAWTNAHLAPVSPSFVEVPF